MLTEKDLLAALGTIYFCQLSLKALKWIWKEYNK